MTDFRLEYCRDHIDRNSIYRCVPGQFIPGKAPNTKYTWQFYLRRSMFDPQFMKYAVELLIEKLGPLENVQFGACEDAGVPLAQALSLKTNIPMFTIKKDRKKYGLLNFTEGIIYDKPVILVDDLAGSQKTFRDAKVLLQAFGLHCDSRYVALVNKTQGTHQTYLEGMRLVHLFTCEDFHMSYQVFTHKYGIEPSFKRQF